MYLEIMLNHTVMDECMLSCDERDKTRWDAFDNLTDTTSLVFIVLGRRENTVVTVLGYADIESCDNSVVHRGILFVIIRL